MNKIIAHDAKITLGAALVWVAFALANAWTWLDMVPLFFLTFIVPAALTSFLESPWLLRPLIGAAPNIAAATFVGFVYPDPDFYLPPVALVLLSGAVAVFVIALPILAVRRLRSNNSFKPKPLRGSA